MATIQGIYIALFGRPADPFGLAFFNEATNNGADLTAIGDLAATAEYQSRFEGQTNVQIVNSIYQSLFNRDADLAGLTFFVNALASGELNINNIAIAIYDGAQNEDLEILQNKEAAANLFTASLDTGAEISAYSGDAAAAAGRAFLDGVTDDDSTIPTQAEVDAAIQAIVEGTGIPGETFTLTDGSDNFTGTANDDTFIGAIDENATIESTLNIGDRIDGGGGRDTLRIISNGDGDEASFIGASIENVERLEIVDVDDDFDTLELNGQMFEAISIENQGGTSSVDIDGVNQMTSFEFVGQDDASADIEFQGSLGGSDDTVNLWFFGAENGDIEIEDDDDGDNVENIVATVDGDIVLDLEAEDGSGDGTLETVTVTGTGDVELDIFSPEALMTLSAEVDGDVTTDLTGATDALETVTFGTGNDQLTLAGTESGVSITGGAGNDTYIFTDVANIDTATEDDFAAEIVSITDFNGAEDFLDLPTLTQVTVTTTIQGDINSQDTLFDAVTYVAENVAVADNELAVFTYEGSTYAFVQGADDAGTVGTDESQTFSADDGLIELTGFTGALNATNFDAA